MSKPKKTTYAIPKQFLGAFKAGHRPAAREYIDEEFSWELLKKIEASKYTDQESIKALEYITKFNNEFHKNVVKKDDPNALHNTPELRKDCYSRENARNRDIMSVEKYKIDSIEPNIVEGESGALKVDNFLNKNRDLANHENVVIALLEASFLIDNPEDPVN